MAASVQRCEEALATWWLHRPWYKKSLKLWRKYAAKGNKQRVLLQKDMMGLIENHIGLQGFHGFDRYGPGDVDKLIVRAAVGRCTIRNVKSYNHGEFHKIKDAWRVADYALGRFLFSIGYLKYLVVGLILASNDLECLEKRIKGDEVTKQALVNLNCKVTSILGRKEGKKIFISLAVMW